MIDLIIRRGIAAALQPKRRRLAERLLVRADDLERIMVLNAELDVDPYFVDEMSRRDAQELLNLNPRGLMEALRGELSRAATDGYSLRHSVVLELGRERISGREVLARYFGGVNKDYRSCRRLWKLDRSSPLGWPRAAAEELLAEIGSPACQEAIRRPP